MDSKRSSAISFPIFFLILSSIFVPKFALKSCDFPAIFGFGDSNSDTGSMETALGLLNPLNGITYFQKPTGRLCDGRLIIDFIAEKLNIPHINAYLNWMGTNFTNGANFANAGATIDVHSDIVSYDESRFANRGATATNAYYSIQSYGVWNPISLQIQYLQFLTFKLNSQLLRKQGGVFQELMPREEYFSKALYMFDIGQNDIVYGLLIGKSIQEVNISIPHIINKFSAIVENVYKSGGRSFWIHNTGPLGCLPFFIVITLPSEKDEAGCVKIYNQLSNYFNFKLNESIVQLRAKFPTATFVYVDIYTVKYSLFTSPQEHGFEIPLVTCWGPGGTYNNETTSGRKIQVNGEEILVNPCNDPSIKVIWDGGHYTEAANKFVFDQISSGAFSHPPIPLEMSCHNFINFVDESFGCEVGDPIQFEQCGIDHNVAF